jgi:hypothetical protein
LDQYSEARYPQGIQVVSKVQDGLREQQ